MKRTAIGIRAHSGWGAVVAVCWEDRLEVVDRRRITIADPKAAGANQPYHFAQEQDVAEAERYLADCAVSSEGLAFGGLSAMVGELRRREYDVVRCAMIEGSGRALPSLSQILASHALIHAAEGEFFRRAFWRAGERMGIEVTGIRERELEGRFEEVFGGKTKSLREEIGGLGRSLGPPWTTDQKTASLAGWLVLASEWRQGESITTPEQMGR